jgi:hypothetical protein
MSNVIQPGSVRVGCLLVYDTKMARIKGAADAILIFQPIASFN